MKRKKISNSVENLNKRDNVRSIGNWVVIGGLFLELMLNLNTYDLYQKMTYINYVLAAAVMTVAFICYIDFKNIIKDKQLLFVVLTDIIALICMALSRTGFLAFLPLFILTMNLYLSDKVVLTKWQWMFTSILCGIFFVYWTIDVKGYFKGYSINFGGLVLLYGFIFVIGLVEYLKWYILCRSNRLSFLKKYPYYIVLFEILLFAWAYKIMSWYRSRTAVVALFVFAIFMCLPWRLTRNKYFVRTIVAVLSGGIFVFPVAYVKICGMGILSDKEVFYKPLITVRNETWSYLFNLIKLNPVTGNGTIIVPQGTVFREGLLDTCNIGLQLLTVHGVIVTLLVIMLFIWTICRLLENISNSILAKVLLATVSTVIVSSYSESSVLPAPFVMMFASILFVGNSVKIAAEKQDDASITIEDAYRKSALLTKEFKDKFIPVLCINVVLLFMYIILGPLEIFYSNYHEFMYNTSDFIWFFLAVMVAVAMVIALVVGSMPKIVSVIYCTAGLSITLVSYIQYMFINSELVDENGNFAASIELGLRYYISIVVAIIIPIAVIASVCLLKKYRDKLFIYSSLFITAIMITAVATIAVNLLMLENKGKYVNVLSGADEFESASEENIIVILLDTFGREALNEELVETPDYLDVLSDFTYYQNADSVYAPTYPSLVHLLTECEYEHEDRIYMEPKAFESDSSKKFFGMLHEKGYKVGLYTRDLIVHDYMYDIADNTAACKVTVNKKDVRNSLLKMSVYRYLPYNIKPYFEVYNPKAMNVACDVDESYAENYEFYQGMKEKGVNVNPEISKKFSLCQLEGGIHIPYISDENLNQVPVNSISKHQVMLGINKLLREYFERLKDIGVYDNATIIVMADHGEKGNTDAIFFKKDSGESHEEVVVNTEPFTYHEFQNVIMNAAQ